MSARPKQPLSLLVAALLLCAGPVARAQPAPASEPPAQPPPSPQPPPSAPPEPAAEPPPPAELPPSAQPVPADAPPPGYAPPSYGYPPYGYPPPTPFVPPLEEPRPGPRRSAAFFIAQGVSYRFLYDIGSLGAETAFYGGLWRPNYGVYGALNAFFGATDGGLFVAHVRVGGLVEGGIPRFRLGGGPQIGFMFVPRATDPRDTLFGISLGITTHARAEIFEWDQNAFYIEGRISAAWNPLLFGGELYLGFRL